MVQNTKCEYCGNTSSLTDRRGNCISCGGELPIRKQEKSYNLIGNDAGGYVAKWDGTRDNFSDGEIVTDILLDGKSVRQTLKEMSFIGLQG